MKEILKYLRQINAFTQEEISLKLNISRQSYIKYEKGAITPSNKIIDQLSRIYNVSTSLILNNQIPTPNNIYIKTYSIPQSPSLVIAEPSFSYSSSANIENRQFLNGIFDGKVIKILDSLENLHIKKGQKIKLFYEHVNDEFENKNNPYIELMSTIQKGRKFELSQDEDPYYKNSIESTKKEIYDSVN